MKLRCAILDDYQNAALTMADWSPLKDKVDVQVFREHIEDESKVANAIKDFEIVIIMRERTPFRATLLKQLPKLKLLITTGMRNAAIDVAAAKAQGVVVCGTASSSEPPTELTWTLIMALARNIIGENEALRNNGPWQHSVGQDLFGKQLGLLGLGKIGSRVAKVGLAFGMKVTAWSQNLTPDKAAAAGVMLASSKEQLLESSDFVSVHLVLGDRSRGLIGANELRKMKPTAYLINTSRAPIVDQPALITALKEKWIAGAAVDVFETEPLPPNDIYRKIPNLLATPHLGYVSDSNYRTYYREAVEDILAFLNGSPVRQLS